MRKRLAWALVASLVLADLGIHALLVDDGLLMGRPLPPFGATPHPRQRRWLAAQRDGSDRGQGTFDAGLGWSCRRSYRSADGKICTNSLGARGTREYEPQRPDGVLRALCFGDSFTWCDQVIDADSWPFQLESEREDLEVLNFGVSGYGTDQALMRFRERGAGLDAQVVWIGLMLENIGRNVNRYRPRWYPKSGACVAKPRFVLEGDGSLRKIPLPYASQSELVDAVESGRVTEELGEHEYWNDAAAPWLRYSSFVRIASSYFAYRRRSVSRLWGARDGEPYRTTLAVLEEFHRAARSGGAERIAVLVFPREHDLDSYLRRGPYWQSLLDDLAAAGIEAIDLTPALAKELSKTGVETPVASLYTGGHLNARGNAIVAARLAEWLADSPARPGADDPPR